VVAAPGGGWFGVRRLVRRLGWPSVMELQVIRPQQRAEQTVD
jgi:hypothetical protein